MENRMRTVIRPILSLLKISLPLLSGLLELCYGCLLVKWLILFSGALCPVAAEPAALELSGHRKSASSRAGSQLLALIVTMTMMRIK